MSHMTDGRKKNLLTAFERGYRVTKDGEIVSPFSKNTKGYVERTGYRNIHISIEGRTRGVPIHRLQAYQKFGDAIFEPGTVVRHLNGIKLDCSWDNIAIGSQSQNVLDRPIEERCATALRVARSNRKFSDTQILEMYRLEKSGIQHSEIARMFGIGASHMKQILDGKMYKDVYASSYSKKDNMATVDEALEDSIKRVLSILSDEERVDVKDYELEQLTSDTWSPGTRYMALTVVKSIIGERHDMRKYLLDKWKKHWDANPEIHF